MFIELCIYNMCTFYMYITPQQKVKKEKETEIKKLI
jgi:hypothetical protein